MKTFRLIRSKPHTGAYNMALDQKIFTRYLEDGVPVLRVYRWSKPAFTYGVSQDPSDDLGLKRCASDGIEVVKRMTGGGILLHDDEITYSFVCSKSDVGEPKSVFVSYREICAFLIRFYGSLGLNASFALSTPEFKKNSAPSDICSASHEKYDIVINGKKMGGNAQKRARQAIFQHGSIPCSINWELIRKYLKNIPADIENGVTTLSGELKEVPDKNTLEDKLAEAFGKEFNVKFAEEDAALYEASVAQ